jgi:hypothetical protein
MENQIDFALVLANARNEVAESVVRAYGAERAYAVNLNTYFGFNWYDVEATDKTEASAPVHAEKKELYKVLHGAKHSNPSTVWGRIRKYGREEAEGIPQAGDVDGDGEGDGEGKRDHNREAMTRNIEELVRLYKFNQRQESAPQKIKDANVHIAKALEALGVNLNMVAG